MAIPRWQLYRYYFFSFILNLIHMTLAIFWFCMCIQLWDWLDLSFFYSPEIHCEDPVIIENTLMNYNSTSYGSLVTYTCENDLYFHETQTRHVTLMCDIDEQTGLGRWNPEIDMGCIGKWWNFSQMFWYVHFWQIILLHMLHLSFIILSHW